MVVIRLKFLALLAAVTQMAAAQRGPYEQCGGIGYAGGTTCAAGYYCQNFSEWYSQCNPGTVTSSTSTSTSTSTPTSTSTSTSTSTPTSTSTSTSMTPSSASCPVPVSTGTSLDAKTKAKGKDYFGTCTDRNTLSDPAYEAIVIAEYGQVTPENSMKWESTENVRDTFTMSDADFLVNWAQQHGKLIRGHTLVWHSQLPAWVSTITDPVELTSVIENHIANVAGRYAGKIHHWDVVNEIFNDDGTWRSSVFYNLLGPQFVDIAFRAAKKADPTAKLFINDYNLDYAGPKVNAIVTLVQRLIADGVPIDGIGSQAHLILNNGAIPSMYQPLATLASTGLKVALTELDIRLPLPVDATKLHNQRDNFNQATAACIRVPNCVGITTWGVSDKYSWVPGVFAGQGAALIWDENFAKKSAYDGAEAALLGWVAY